MPRTRTARSSSLRDCRVPRTHDHGSAADEPASCGCAARQAARCTQNGDAVLLGIPACPAAGGTASGDVITVGNTVCPESNGVKETFAGGTLPLDGDSLVVSIDLAVAGDGVSGTGTLTGTLTK